MGYLGLVPSEHSSGKKRALGAITKTGNSHARRLLIEAGWNYRYPARISLPLQKRQEGQPTAIRDISWKAQLRLSHRYRRLTARGLQPNKICVAIARELAGFIWSIGQLTTIKC
jgi:transposase